MGVSIIKGKTGAGANKTVLLDTDGAVILNPANVTAMTPPAITQTKSQPFTPYSSLQRPNNATPYTAGKVFGTAADSVLTFAICAPANAGGGTITGVSVSSTAGTAFTFDLHLFNATPSAAIVDQAAFSLDSADVSAGKWVGKIKGLTLSKAGASDATSHEYAESKLTFLCAAASTALYGRLVVTGGVTPGALETVWAQLHILP